MDYSVTKEILETELKTLRVLSSEMDPAEIMFSWKTLIKEIGEEIVRKIGPSPILWEPFKVTAQSRTAVGHSETNSQRGNEIHRAVGIGGTCVGLFKGWTKFPHSLCSPVQPLPLQLA